jgi:predicted nucleotidyltransferase component of viral defense system
MILPNPKDAVHKAWMYRLLTAISDDDELSRALAFKGGTCAAMLGWLDRFSIDLDFDLFGEDPVKDIRRRLEAIFLDLGLEIKDHSTKVPQYFLRYPVQNSRQRSTLKIDITFPPPKSNQYAPHRLVEIDRIITCQTKETMFANKLVAFLERFEKHGSIAARDLYDINHFFLSGFSYDSAVILERRTAAAGNPGYTIKGFLVELERFIQNEVTQKVLDQDLNPLLTKEKFQAVRKTLKQEALMFVRAEINRVR